MSNHCVGHKIEKCMEVIECNFLLQIMYVLANTPVKQNIDYMYMYVLNYYVTCVLYIV